MVEAMSKLRYRPAVSGGPVLMNSPENLCVGSAFLFSFLFLTNRVFDANMAAGAVFNTVARHLIQAHWYSYSGQTIRTKMTLSVLRSINTRRPFPEGRRCYPSA
jgi:hypothetical protein